MDWLTLLLLWLTFCLLIAIFWISPPENFPPGPATFPLIGSIPALARIKKPTQQDVAWSLNRKYGSLSGIYLGPWPVVVVSGYQAIKHVLSREDLAFRPNVVPPQTYFFNARLGFFFRDGVAWREQRRFTLRHLRDFGYARRAMEGVVHEEMRTALATVERDRQCDLAAVFALYSANVILHVMASKRHDPDDVEFRKIVEYNHTFFRNSDPLSIVVLYPLLQVLPFGNSQYKNQLAAIKPIQKYIETIVDEHLATYDENHMRDFIDDYITEMKAKPESTFTKDQLVCAILDMFTAATEATGNAMMYGLRYLVQYANVQRKLRDEIYRVVGTERLPGMDDIPQLHYAVAFVNETLRHSGLLPFAAPHATNVPTEVLGYHVPQETVFLANLWSMHMDPEIWGDPENYRPERFITVDGTYKKSDCLLPFSFGPRLCMGETVSRQIIVLILAAMVQRFKFDVPQQSTPPSTEQLPGIVTAPAPFKVKITPA